MKLILITFITMVFALACSDSGSTIQTEVDTNTLVESLCVSTVQEMNDSITIYQSLYDEQYKVYDACLEDYGTPSSCADDIPISETNSIDRLDSLLPICEREEIVENCISLTEEIYANTNRDSICRYDDNAPYIINLENQVYALLDTVEIVFSEAILELNEDNYSADSIFVCDFKEDSYTIIQCIPATTNLEGLPILPADSEFGITFSYITDFSNNIAYSETYRFVAITEEWYDEYGYEE